MMWQLAAAALLALALASGFAWYERSRPDARIVALVAMLAAFAALGRIAFAAIPNVKPTTDIVLISGYALGGAPGFVVGALAGLTSNFFFGQGPWTPWQMAAWGSTGVLGAGLALIVPRRIGRWPLAVICGVAGFAFTAVQDLGDWVTYSDHSLAQLGVYVGKGIGFDAVHALGCVAFALAFGPALIRSIRRFARRLQVTWKPATPTAVVTAIAFGLGALTTGWLASEPGSSSAAATPTTYLLGAQNSDGGFGSSPGASSSQLFSGWAALGLAAEGQNPRTVRRAGHGLIDYIGAGASSLADAGSLERTILAVRAAGLSPTSFYGHDLIGALQHDIRGGGSVSDQVNLTAFAVLALRSAGVALPPGTSRWLAAQQNSDGGFSFSTRGGASDVDDTGAALEALAADGAGPGRAVGRAVGFVRANQNSDGGFPSTPGGDSNAQSTAWAVQGLLAAGGASGAVQRGLQYLGSLVAPDGHVRYSRGSDQTPVWVTAEAAMALAQKPLPLAPLAVARRPGPPVATAAPGRPPGARVGHLEPRAPRRKARHPAMHAHASLDLTPLAVDAGALTAIALAPLG